MSENNDITKLLMPSIGTIDEDTEYKKTHLVSLMQNTLTLTEAKSLTALMFIAAKQHIKDKSIETFSADIRDIEAITKVKYKRSDFISMLLNLKKKEVVLNYVAKHGPRINAQSLLSRIDIGVNDDDKIIIYEFPKTIREQLSRPDYYTLVNMISIAEITSKYTYAIYQLCKSYAGVGKTEKMSVEKWREFLFVENDYPLFAEFERNIFKKAEKEINENDKINIKISYEKTKVGKKVTSVQFFVSQKTKQVEVKPKTEQEDKIQLFMALMPMSAQTEKNYRLIERYLKEKGELYCLANLQYTWQNLKQKGSYSVFLEKALNEHWGHEIERRMMLEHEIRTLRGGNPNYRDMDPRADRDYVIAYEKAIPEKRAEIDHQLSRGLTSGTIKKDAPKNMQIRQAMQLMEIWL